MWFEHNSISVFDDQTSLHDPVSTFGFYFELPRKRPVTIQTRMQSSQDAIFKNLIALKDRPGILTIAEESRSEI